MAAMADVPLARVRYQVRMGALTFGERVLDCFSTMGTDPVGDVFYTPPGRVIPSSVIEIVDADRGCVVRRIRDDAESVRILYAAITLDLDRLDVAAFACCWDCDEVHPD